jgi:hypothetical protein
MPSLPHRLLLTVALVLPIAGCGERGGQNDPSAAQAAARQALERVEAARGEGLHEAALIYARELVERHPDSVAAALVRGEMEALEAAALAQQERRRLAALWTYHAVDGEAGTMRTAYIHGVAEGEPAPAVRLVARRHPEWGQSTYLLIGNGDDFACRDRCTVELAFDDAEAVPFGISRAPDVDPPAVFIDDDQTLLARLAEAGRLRLAIPLADGREARLAFETGGFDPQRLQDPPVPAADGAPAAAAADPSTADAR